IPTGESSPFTPPRARAPRGLLGIAVGLLVGLGIAVLLERFDTSLRSREEVEEAFGRPVMAEVPLTRDGGRELVAVAAPASAAAEAYRTLRTALLLRPREALPQANGDGGAAAAARGA